MSAMSDFLLARIAEDETIANRWPEDSPSLAPNGHVYVDPHGHPIYGARSRLLAECEAKRAIIERIDIVSAEGRAEYANEALDDILGYLAMPYAQHADFDPRWTTT